MKQKCYPWLILFCCCGISMASISLTTNAAGLFLNPIAQSFQVGIGSVSFYSTISSIVCGLMGPPAAWILKRIPLRRLLGISAIGAALCQVGYANISAVWQLYVFAVVQSLFTTLLGYLPIAAIINNWFERFRGFALGFSFACGGLGNVILNPFITGWIESYGWRRAYLLLAVVMLIASAPAILFCRLTPAELALTRYGESSAVHPPASTQNIPKSVSNCVSTRSSLPLMLCVMIFFGASIPGFGTHMASYAASVGLPASSGALMASATMAGNTSSKAFLGVLCDLLTPKRACWISLSMVTVGFSIMLLYPGQSLPVLLFASFLIGVSYSTGNIGASALSRDLFGAEDFAANYSRVHLAAYIGFALSCTAMGVAFDHFHSYVPSMVYSLVTAVFCLFSIGALYRRKRT